MQQLSSITPLEIILLALAAVGVFYFFRACWRNIKRSRQHLGVALLTLMMVLTAQTAQAQWSGSGTEADPYLITSTSDLDLLATNVNSGEQYFKVYFKQTKDIAYSTEGVGDTESNFTAIGNYSNSFRGHYDGQGHTISGIRIYKGGKNDADQCQGLFGKSYEDIQGITLTDARITGYHNTGGIVGCSFGTVSDCHVAADVYIHAVQSNANSHGGIVGGSNRCSVSDCTSAATLTMPNGGTGSLYGGIAGANTLGTLRNNVAIGAVVPAADNSRYGAISGSNDYGTLQNNCYYACTVAGVENATGVGCGNADVTNNNGAVNASPDHFEQTGTNEYTIKTALGWNLFCGLLATEAKGYFTGKTVKLNGDITVSRMAGASYHDFTGTFNGQGYTLTFNYTTDAENAAPFQYVEDATIQNLHVAGTIQTSNKYAAGIIAQQYGKVTISDCQSSVIIKSSTSGDGTHGGFVAVNQKNASLTIQDCVFDGKLLTTNGTTNCGGFVGYSNSNKGATATVTNSLYTPAALGNGEKECTSGSATFVRNGEAGTNCHFSRTLGTAQGGGLPTFLTRGDGDGTSANPYKITNANDLKDLACYVNGTGTYSNGLPAGVAHNCSGVYFQQTNPITLTSDWTPIGTSSTNPFKGNYDGGKNAISGLTVSGNYKYAGLFGYISSDRVNGSLVSNELQNINIVDCNINVGSVSGSEAGAIAGETGPIHLSGCRVSGSITGYGYASGLVGNANQSYGNSVTDCFVDVTVSGTGNQYNQSITPTVRLMISAQSNTLTASGNYYHDNGSNVTVGCSATPLYTISAPSGMTMPTTNATLTYNDTHYFATETAITLSVDDADKSIIAFTATGAASSSVADDKKSATITVGSSDVTVSATLMTIDGTSNGVTWSMSDSDSNGTIDRLTLSGSGTLSTSPWATDFAASITRVDISSADIAISGNPFSTLGSSAVIVAPTPAYAVSYASAAFADKLRVALGNYLFLATNEGGTAAYAITDKADLKNLAFAVKDGNSGEGKIFRQTGNIDLGNGNFVPIGLDPTKCFSGTYDGGGYTISSLHVNFLANIYTYGLFGHVRNGLVENVRLVSPSVNVNNAYNTYNYVGALIGCADGTNGASTTIRNCVVINPEINAIGSAPGAIIGVQVNCELRNLYFYGGNCNNAIGAGYSGTDAVRASKVFPRSGVSIQSEMADDLGFSYDSDGDGTPENYWRQGAELTLANNLGEAPEGYAVKYTATAGTISGSTLTVGSANAVVNAAIRSDGQSHSISYVDENGDDATHDAIALDGTETTLSAGWYFVGKDINYTQTVNLDGDATLILTDGKTMNVGTSESRISGGGGIVGKSYPLSIYGQSNQSGTLNAYSSTGNYAVYVESYAQHGGIVTLDASKYYALCLYNGNLTLTRGTLNAKASDEFSAIDFEGDYIVTVSGGTLNATCGAAAICGFTDRTVLTMTGGTVNATGKYGIWGDVIMTGGNLTANGTENGIYGGVTFSGGNLTANGSSYGIRGAVSLSWTSTDDSFYASSFGGNGTVTIADGNAFYNGSEVLSGTISDKTNKLAGKTLTPACIITLPEGITATGVLEQNGTTAYAKAGDAITLAVASGYLLNGDITYTPDGGSATATTEDNGSYSFTMPAGNVTVNANIIKIISYIDADGKLQTINNYKKFPAEYNSGWELTTTTLNAGEWYVVDDNIDLYKITNVLTVSGEGAANIILCDGKTFYLSCTEYGYINGSLNIYGQSEGTGKINYDNSQRGNPGLYQLIKGNLTIYGGQVILVGHDAEEDICGQYAISGNVTIYCGSLYAKGGDDNFDNASSGMDAINGDVTFYGGSLTAIGGKGLGDYPDASGINGKVTLSWSNANDRFYASSYFNPDDVTIADGKAFYNGSEVLTGTPDDSEKLDGKTLTPISGVKLTNDGKGNISASFDGTTTTPVVIPAAIEVSAVALKRSFTADKASTVMLPFDYTCNEADGGEFYDFAGVEKNEETNQWVATMTKVNQLKANTPYMFVAANDIDGITFTLPEKVTLNTTGGGECQKADKGSHWTFKGTYSYMKWTSDTKDAEYTQERADEIGKVYGFAGVAKDDIKLGDFVKAASGARIRPLTCYLIWNNTPNSTRGMTRAAGDEELPSSIVVRLLSNIGPGDQGDDNGNQGNDNGNQGNDDNGGTTTIGTLDTETGEIDFGGWYTLSGRKLDTKSTQKGLYIHNGRKIVIK